MKYLQLIRFQNLLLLALMQWVMRYLFLTQSYIDLALTDINYLLLVVSTVCIAAGGAVMQHIVNQEEDEMIQPQKRVVGNTISEAAAYNWYIGLTIIGVGVGFYLSNVIYKPTFASLFILAATLLYVKATNLNRIPLVGTIISALLVAISILVIALFDVFPATDAVNKIRMGEAFGILIDYAVFGFLLVLVFELFSTLKNKENDDRLGNATVATRLGNTKTKIIIGVITLFLIVLILYYSKVFLFELTLVLCYLLLALVGPLLFFAIKLIGCNTTKEFKILERTLYFVILFSILSIAVIVYNLKNA
ncbi:geranylgeranylglycerol-phosphate geranylgeranyltransferase [Flavobacterium sp.]|jgi:4-hydroxybenzoate polyprenyltransferase|uniref:geranylgeranylglycerol-phosphate geranylgeranyltransferase n=1 Tax=Flavobacterium sp. TaxID=239 RepID=UPI0037BF53FE